MAMDGLPLELVSAGHAHTAECDACMNFLHMTMTHLLADIYTSKHKSIEDLLKDIEEEWGIEVSDIKAVADARLG